MTTAPLDPARTEAFAGRMTSLLNDAFLSVLVSIGHRTELYERLAELPAATSEEIASAASLDERYVREWLAGMVTGGILDYDAATGTYELPPEHAALLTRAAGPDNLAFFTQYVALTANVEDAVVDCFRTGGGVPYSAYPGFQALQGEESARLFDTKLLDEIVPLAEGLAGRLAEGIDVLDVGCGQGHAVNVLAQAFPASRLTGYDFSEEGVAAARAEASELGLGNARFEARDIAGLDDPERYDLVLAIDVIHDLARPEATLAAIHRALRPGGMLFMIDMAGSSHLHENLDHPIAPLLYSVSLLHCMTVSLAQGGPGLGAMWGEETARALLAEAGFEAVELRRLEDDVMHAFYVATR